MNSLIYKLQATKDNSKENSKTISMIIHKQLTRHIKKQDYLLNDLLVL